MYGTLIRYPQQTVKMGIHELYMFHKWIINVFLQICIILLGELQHNPSDVKVKIDLYIFLSKLVASHSGYTYF